MYSLEDLNKRIAYLKSISPSGGAKVLDDLMTVITNYFQRDESFTLDVNKCLDKVIADTFHYELIYQNMDLLPEWLKKRAENPPIGYRNIKKLFSCGDIFDEIMSVDDNDFIRAFYTVSQNASSGGNGGGGTTVEWHNRYVDTWISMLESAMQNETEGLKNIMHYCANRSYGYEYAILFEELGDNVKRHSVRYYAKRIYLTRGWGWLVDTFNLEVYRPSYMQELSDWTEDEDDINAEGYYDDESGDEVATESRNTEQES